MFKVNIIRGQDDVNGVFIFNVIVNFTYSGVLVSLLLALNIFHILHDVKNAKIRVYTAKNNEK